MATKIPAFSYTGACSTELKNGYWYIYLTSNGTLTFSYAKTLEACIVGGGAGGWTQGGGCVDDKVIGGASGGSGGTVNNVSGISAAANTGYAIVVGAGGAAGNNGYASSAFGHTAAGGAVVQSSGHGGAAGANGTYAFWDTSLRRYGACGGNGGPSKAMTPGEGGDYGGGRGAYGGMSGTIAQNAIAGAANSGSGGGGAGGSYMYDSSGGYHAGGDAAAGGSGIVILRGTQDDLLPVRFNGTQLSAMTFGGKTVTGLIYNGTRIFARRCANWLYRRWARRFGFRRATPAM